MVEYSERTYTADELGRLRILGTARQIRTAAQRRMLGKVLRGYRRYLRFNERQAVAMAVLCRVRRLERSALARSVLASCLRGRRWLVTSHCRTLATFDDADKMLRWLSSWQQGGVHVFDVAEILQQIRTGV